MKKVSTNHQQFTPSKIVCVGRNYVEHIEELNNEMPTQMVVFNKPNSAISETLNSFHQEILHYEAELCLLVSEGQPVALGVGLDLTKRALQSALKTKGLPWERAKAFDGSVVLSEFVVIDDSMCQPNGELKNELGVGLFINGQLTQTATIGLMIHKPAEILQEIESYSSLVDGDIIMTGTPKGVGVIEKGAIFEATVCLGEEVLVSKKWQAQ